MAIFLGHLLREHQQRGTETSTVGQLRNSTYVIFIGEAPNKFWIAPLKASSQMATHVKLNGLMPELVTFGFRCKIRMGQCSLILWAIRGYQEFYANSLKLPRWRNPKPCWECNLSGEQCLKIQRNVEDECRARRSPHLIFTIPGVSHFTICQDAMHILFCKGVLSHCMGNTLQHWCWQSHILCWPAAQGTVGNNIFGDSAALQAVPDHGCA